MITKCFVGGTVVEKVEGVEDCVAGIDVGEFVIDKLEPNSGSYHLDINGSQGRFSKEFVLGEESRYLGVMTLSDS